MLVTLINAIHSLITTDVTELEHTLGKGSFSKASLLLKRKMYKK